MFVIWFVSGIVMMYAGGMPSLSTAERLERKLAIDFAGIAVEPADAVAAAGLERPPRAMSLGTVLGRPAYELGGGFGGSVRVFADTGDVFEGIGVDEAGRVAAAFADAPAEAVRFVQTVETPDQWTLALRRSLPLHEFHVDDGAGTRVYVSPRSAEVALATDRVSRALAWAGTIPHWFYVTPLRLNQPLWYGTVVWASVLGCVLAVLGLVLSVTQFRRSRPFRLSASIRYRGWMRWHYLTGALFGVFALTWVFSGLMSMEPFGWTNASGLEVPRDAFTGGPIDPAAYGALDAPRWNALLGDGAAKQVEFLRIRGAAHFSVRYDAPEREGLRDPGRVHQPYPLLARGGRRELLVDARTLAVRDGPFATGQLIADIRRATDAPIASHEMLSDYDAYYYSQDGRAPLPVLRVKFDDPMQTWYYVDPARAQFVASTHRLSRIERWLFNGLHSLDFAFWYDKRPLWDVGMIVLSLGALATSLIGMCLGFRRLFRPARGRRGRNG